MFQYLFSSNTPENDGDARWALVAVPPPFRSFRSANATFTCILKFVLRLLDGAGSVRVDQVGIRVFSLRVFVHGLEVGRRGGGVHIVVELLDVLAVVAFFAAEAKETLLQDAILAVPNGQAKTQAALAVL